MIILQVCFEIRKLSVKQSYKDWLQFNLDSGFTAKQFHKDINAIKTKYPMLKYAGKSVNTCMDQTIRRQMKILSTILKIVTEFNLTNI